MNKYIISDDEHIRQNRRTLQYYSLFENLRGNYNYGKIVGDVFELYRIKDDSLIRSFNIKTFLPS